MALDIGTPSCTSTRSALRSIPAATTASADFSLRLITVAPSGARRDLPG